MVHTQVVDEEEGLQTWTAAISSNRHPTKVGPPAWGLDVGLYSSSQNITFL
jgi:hypothetical protein